MDTRQLLMLVVQLLMLTGLFVTVRRTGCVLRRYRRNGILLHQLPLVALRHSLRTAEAALLTAERLLANRRQVLTAGVPGMGGRPHADRTDIFQEQESCLPIRAIVEEPGRAPGSTEC
jgi:hypothetical protein